MATCTIHGDEMIRIEGDEAYCQKCFECAGEDCVPCDGPGGCSCNYECERMTNHQRWASTEHVI